MPRTLVDPNQRANRPSQRSISAASKIKNAASINSSSSVLITDINPHNALPKVNKNGIINNFFLLEGCIFSNEMSLITASLILFYHHTLFDHTLRLKKFLWAIKYQCGN